MATPRTNASHDQNRIPTLIGVSTADGTTPVPVEVDPVTGQLQVSGAAGASTDITSVIPGVGATNLGKADDAPMATNDVGVMALAVANEAQTNMTSTDGDYTPIGVDRAGRQYSKITDGTNIANILKSDGTAAGQNAQFVAGANRELSGLTAGSLSADLIPSTDVSNFRSISLQVTGTFVGTLSFQASNDNFATTAISTMLYKIDAASSAVVNLTTTIGVFSGGLLAKYFRVRMTSYTSGTATGTAELNTQPAIPSTLGATQSGTWSVGASSATGSAVPANAFYVGVSDSGGALQGASSIQLIADGNSGNRSLATGHLSYNGTTYDRFRNNNSVVVVAAGTTTTSTTTLTTYNARELVIVVNVSAYTSGTINLAVNGVTTSAYNYSLLSSITGLVATGVNVYRVGVGLTPAAGLVANDVLPRSVQIVVSGTFSATYGIDAVLGL